MDHGLTFDICQVSRTHILVDVHPLSPLRPYIPTKYSQNHYVVSIDNIEPFFSDSTDELVHNLQIRKKTNQVNLVLHPLEKSSILNYKKVIEHITAPSRYSGTITLQHTRIWLWYPNAYLMHWMDLIKVSGWKHYFISMIRTRLSNFMLY